MNINEEVEEMGIKEIVIMKLETIKEIQNVIFIIILINKIVMIKFMIMSRMTTVVFMTFVFHIKLNMDRLFIIVTQFMYHLNLKNLQYVKYFSRYYCCNYW